MGVCLPTNRSCFLGFLGLLGCPGASEVAPRLSCGAEAGEAILFVEGGESGFVRCAGGSVNRATAVAVPGRPQLEACDGSETTITCASDADCSNPGEIGHCVRNAEHDLCGCVYTSCFTDSDCGAGAACVPYEWFLAREGPLGELMFSCQAATCREGIDCASGECGARATEWSGCHGSAASLACRDAAQDTCRSEEDCDGPGCAFMGDGWECPQPCPDTGGQI